jgi:Tfp pilus assembly protein PilZ
MRYQVRRRWKRVQAGFDVMYRIGDQNGVAAAVDISGGGIFVNVEKPPRVGDSVYLTFVLPGVAESSAVKVIGEVVRTVPPGTRGLRPGFGVSFVALQQEGRKSISDFVQRAATARLEDAELGDAPGEIIEIEPDEK